MLIFVFASVLYWNINSDDLWFNFEKLSALQKNLKKLKGHFYNTCACSD